jgi:hypothetical protein
MGKEVTLAGIDKVVIWLGTKHRDRPCHERTVKRGIEACVHQARNHVSVSKKEKEDERYKEGKVEAKEGTWVRESGG